MTFLDGLGCPLFGSGPDSRGLERQAGEQDCLEVGRGAAQLLCDAEAGVGRGCPRVVHGAHLVSLSGPLPWLVPPCAPSPPCTLALAILGLPAGHSLARGFCRTMDGLGIQEAYRHQGPFKEVSPLPPARRPPPMPVPTTCTTSLLSPLGVESMGGAVSLGSFPPFLSSGCFTCSIFSVAPSERLHRQTLGNERTSLSP